MNFRIEKIHNENDIDKNFTCGLKYIDDNIKESYYAFLCNHLMIFLCKVNNQTIGYILFCIDSVDCRKSEIMTEYCTNSKSFGVIYMNYIAIDIKEQHKKYGKTFLSIFIQYIKQYKKTIPLRFIVIESLKERIDWYSDIGFKLLENKSNEGNSQMYYDLLDEDEIDIINNYRENII